MQSFLCSETKYMFNLWSYTSGEKADPMWACLQINFTDFSGAYYWVCVCPVWPKPCFFLYRIMLSLDIARDGHESHYEVNSWWTSQTRALEKTSSGPSHSKLLHCASVEILKENCPTFPEGLHSRATLWEGKEISLKCSPPFSMNATAHNIVEDWGTALETPIPLSLRGSMVMAPIWKARQAHWRAWEGQLFKEISFPSLWVPLPFISSGETHSCPLFPYLEGKVMPSLIFLGRVGQVFKDLSFLFQWMLQCCERKESSLKNWPFLHKECCYHRALEDSGAVLLKVPFPFLRVSKQFTTKWFIKCISLWRLLRPHKPQSFMTHQFFGSCTSLIIAISKHYQGCVGRHLLTVL